MDCLIERIVIVGADRGLGDLLLMTPVFQAIREKLPAAYLEAWINPRWRCAVEGNPYLSSIRSVPFRPNALMLTRLWRSLRRRRPQAVLILFHSCRFARLARWAGISLRAGRVDNAKLSGSLARLLTHPAPLQPWMHRVEHNLSVAEVLFGHPLPRYRLSFMPIHHFPSSFRLEALPPAGNYIVLHLGTGGTQPYWLPERFAQVGTYLAQKYNLHLVLSGTVNEHEMAARCQELLKARAANMVGKLSVLEMAEVLRHARMLISVDTGVVHLAAAVGTPCVALYPRKDTPPFRWYPWQVPHETVSPTEYCAGCTSTSCLIKKRGSTLHCVASLYAEQVFEAADRLIRSTEEGYAESRYSSL